MSNSARPLKWQPTRLPRPWDSPGKNTGVGCHFLLQCMKVKSESEIAQSCPIPSDPMDCTIPGSSVHGIFQQEYWSGVPLPSPTLRPRQQIYFLSLEICLVWTFPINEIIYYVTFCAWLLDTSPLSGKWFFKYFLLFCYSVDSFHFLDGIICSTKSFFSLTFDDVPLHTHTRTHTHTHTHTHTQSCNCSLCLWCYFWEGFA